MTKTALLLAAALAAGPATAFAQSPQHMVPGEDHRIPSTPRMSEQPLAAYPENPARPGDSYRIAAAPRTSSQPLAAYQTDPSMPGDGYRITPMRP